MRPQLTGVLERLAGVVRVVAFTALCDRLGMPPPTAASAGTGRVFTVPKVRW